MTLLVCPDPKCAELNVPSAVRCVSCGKRLLPDLSRKGTWS